MTYYPGWDITCPDCKVPSQYGGWHYVGCGLSKSEHKRMAKLRVKARAEAHRQMVEAKEQTLLPRAIIEAIYDEAERRVRGF